MLTSNRDRASAEFTTRCSLLVAIAPVPMGGVFGISIAIYEGVGLAIFLRGESKFVKRTRRDLESHFIE
jgi:hypothetical protein